MEIDTTDARMGPVRTRAFLRHLRTNAHKYNAPPPPPSPTRIHDRLTDPCPLVLILAA